MDVWIDLGRYDEETNTIYSHHAQRHRFRVYLRHGLFPAPPGKPASGFPANRKKAGQSPTLRPSSNPMGKHRGASASIPSSPTASNRGTICSKPWSGPVTRASRRLPPICSSKWKTPINAKPGGKPAQGLPLLAFCSADNPGGSDKGRGGSRRYLIEYRLLLFFGKWSNMNVSIP